MAYSKTFNVYWFCPPRTGSRSTAEIRKHFFFVPKAHQLPDLDLGDFYLVSNFRNPYSRAVSIFQTIFSNFPNKTSQDFKKFLEKKIEDEKKGINYSETIFYLSINNVFKKLNKQPDTLVRLENIVDDVKNLWFVKNNLNEHIEKEINENLVQNKFVSQSSLRPHWTGYYDKESSEMIYYYLREDFILGKYDQNSWKINF